ncbi:MAG TPA: nickel/cobalt transporter [Methyloceanibacter sp.]|nr:nickel/cobalt transporter [Methyloceanibacter sp.]
MRAASRLLASLGLGLLLLLAALVPAGAETKPPSPFGVPVQGAAPSAFAPQAAAPVQGRGPFGKLLSWVADTQQSMQRELATSVKRLKSGNAIGAALALAGLSFLYGVVHAIGPGHGKAIISSYVVANEETVRRGIMISFLAAGLQALTAILLVGLLLIGLNATGLEVTAWSNQLESVSYALIALVGLYLLWTQASRLWRRYGAGAATEAAHHRHAHVHAHDHHGHGHDHRHAHGEACDHIVDARQLAGPFSWRKVMAVVFSVGIRPCTGAILVLVFALTQGLFWAGVAATFAMAIGTAITVAVLATLALGSRELALKLGGASAVWAEAVWTVCAIGGAAIIFMFGLLLFLASLGPARPF